MTALAWVVALLAVAAPARFFWCCCDTTPGHPLSGCPCATVPDALFMHVASQPPTGNSVAFPAAISYGPRPADLSAYGIATTGWYSGKFTSTNGFSVFRYSFTCDQGSYVMSGVLTPDSPIGYPGIFLIASWLVGLPGNTCTPYSLHNTNAANPTINSQHVTLDGTGPP